MRKVTWACGPEWALQQEIEDHFCEALAGLANRHTLWVSALNEPQTWDYLLTTPPAGGQLWIVHDAQDMRMAPDRMDVLLETLADLSYVLFISEETEFTRQADNPQMLAPHLAAIRDSKDGQLVRCNQPSKEDDLLKLVASWWPGAGLNFAAVLFARCAEQLGIVYTVCRTAQAAALEPDERGLDMACQSVPQAKYADEVLAGHRAIALEQAAQLSDAEAASVLKLLGLKLASLSAYNALKARGMDAEQIARRGVDRWHQQQLAPYAGAYPASRAVYCRRLLAMAEDAFRSGVRDGLLESVATLW